MRISERLERRKVIRSYHGSDEMFAQQRPNRDQPPGTERYPEIQHIVLLMMENHSFDNYFGTLGHGEGLPLAADGTPLPLTMPDGQLVPFHRDGTTRQIDGSPRQSWHANHLQYDGGRCDGFVRSVTETLDDPTPAQTAEPMRYWTVNDLPYYARLAREFTLADHWFCSCLGPTFPNRRFLIAGTADGLIDDLPFGMVDQPKAGTIFGLLTRNDITWANYHSASQKAATARRALGRTGLSLFRRLGGVVARFLPPVLIRSIGNLQFTADLYPLGFFGVRSHIRSIDDFLDAAAKGTLPQVSLVDPDFKRTSEENPQDIADGQAFAQSIIEAVQASPCWGSTVLIWFYDEHGGYYDHVPPPAAVPPDDRMGHSLLQLPAPVRWLTGKLAPALLHQVEQLDGDSDRVYDRLGFRVPAVIVSPYARKGQVVSDVFDHTSVLRLIEDKWNLPSLTERDAAANSPIVALDLGD
jgi:phospholipase C